MDDISVDKASLIEKLVVNRDEHKAIFEDANTNYRQKCVEALLARAEEIQNGGNIDTGFFLPKPEDHTSDYDDAIEALKWEKEDTVMIDRHLEFAQWVLNKWGWDRSFTQNTKSYSSSNNR